MERVLLVGFMGSGKSTVGRLLARRIGWRFVDVDAQVEAAVGCTVAELFARDGEAAFRRLEDRFAREALGTTEIVIATGGGWPAREDRMARLPAGTLSVWLQIDAGIAVRRTARRPGTRPLLDVDDPLETARRLLREREPHYRRADLHLRSGGASPDDVVRAILEALPDAVTRIDTPRRPAPKPPRSLN